MYKANYIIATYGYNIESRGKGFNQQIDYLKIHIKRILENYCYISQISIVIPIDIDKELIDEYYKITDIINNYNIKIKYYWCDNLGYSFGQFLKAFELFDEKFDYYFLIEDDYVPSKKYFDKEIIEYYNDYNLDKSFLCGFLENTNFNSIKKNEKDTEPFSVELFFFLDYSTFEFFIKSIKLKYQTINNFLNNYVPKNILIKKRYKDKKSKFIGYQGGYYQLIFTEFILELNIKIFDITPKYNIQIYWDSFHQTAVFLKKGYNAINKDILFVPIDIYRDTEQVIKSNRDIVYIVGMHRSGTSLMSSIINDLGYSLGKNINRDKDYANKLGYFENDSFTLIHDKIMARRNSYWNEIVEENFDIFFDFEKNEYCDLINTEFKEENKILIKDPRVSFFIPLIKDVFLNDNLKIIIMKRNLKSCINSLESIHSLEYNKSKKLYDLTYKFIDNNKNLKTLIINYEDFDKNFKKICNDLSQFLKIDQKKIKNNYKDKLHRFKINQ